MLKINLYFLFFEFIGFFYMFIDLLSDVEEIHAKNGKQNLKYYLLR